MPVEPQQPHKIDFRIYIGILFFRWQIIAVCFLWCLLGGILYVQLAPKEWLTKCSLMIYREADVKVGAPVGGPWGHGSIHHYLLTGQKLRARVARSLLEEWGEEMGGLSAMALPVSVGRDHRLAATMAIRIKSGNTGYAENFLGRLLVEHESEWRSIQRMATDRAAELLDGELARLEERIRAAEDDVIEYQRLNDIPRMTARATMESRYLSALMSRRSMLSTELMLLEAQTPALKGENASVINDINRLTLETGSVEPYAEAADENGEKGERGKVSGLVLPAGALERTEAARELVAEGEGWQGLRVRLVRLKRQERDLAAYMKAEHPQLSNVRSEIRKVENQLEVAAEVAFGGLRDRHKALTTHLKALEAAEYKWQAKNLMAIQRQGELKRLTAVVKRFEKNYGGVYARLHEMKVAEELKSASFRLVEPVRSESKPVWPDAAKIMLMSLALGLGSGFGLALLAQVLDNKVQSIDDVERDLKIPFLGGIPYWVHSGLEKTIRPIVTEEHSTGAVEAYRSLRTAVIAALEKINEKIIFVTSADSKEGKTLTTLNLAIMLAQMDKKVLLIDMDLRRGRLHRSLGIEKQPGVNDALRERLGFEEVTKESRMANLHMIPSGSSVENCAEMLQEADLRAMFTEIEDDYDYIFVDTAPVLRVTDTVIISTQGFGVVLYVARVGKTPLPLIRYSLEMLSDARILGLIMNSIEMHKISSLYYSYQYPNYAYYSSAYAYGYDYYYYGDRTTGRRRGRRRRGGIGRAIEKMDAWFRRTFLPMD